VPQIALVHWDDRWVQRDLREEDASSDGHRPDIRLAVADILSPNTKNPRKIVDVGAAGYSITSSARIFTIRGERNASLP